MKRYRRSAIENFIFRMRSSDMSKFSDDYLTEQLIMLRRMKHWVDVSAQETKATFKLVRGGKQE